MKSKTLFLLSHQPNQRFVKQIKYLSTSSEVNVIYFYRDYMKDLSIEYSDDCKLNENIASISNGNYFQRIVEYLQSIQKLCKLLKSNRYDTLIVNNIDTFILYKLCSFFQKENTKIVIEISDLRSHTYTNSFKSKNQFVSNYNLNIMKKILLDIKYDFINNSNDKQRYDNFSIDNLTMQLEQFFISI